MSIGAECKRCGSCCSQLPCGLAAALLDDHTRPCEALLTNKDGTHSCGLAEHPSDYINFGEHVEWKEGFCQELFTHLVGIGAGCCHNYTDKAFYKQLNEHFSFVKNK